MKLQWQWSHTHTHTHTHQSTHSVVEITFSGSMGSSGYRRNWMSLCGAEGLFQSDRFTSDIYTLNWICIIFVLGLSDGLEHYICAYLLNNEIQQEQQSAASGQHCNSRTRETFIFYVWESGDEWWERKSKEKGNVISDLEKRDRGNSGIGRVMGT